MSWPLVKLGELCTVVRGSSPRPKGDPRYYGGNIPRLMVSDVTRDGKLVTPKIDFLTEAGADKSRPMKKGDFVIAVSGQPGQALMLAVDACIHDGFAGLRDLNEIKISKDYLFHFMNSAKKRFAATAAGAIFKNLTTEQIRELEIPLPPLKEQKRIAAILDKADAIRRKRQQAIKLADDFLRSVFLDMFGDPVTNPKGWDVVHIEEICSDIVDCINKTAKIVGYETRYKMIRTTNVRNMKIDLTGVRCVEKSVYDKWVCRLKPERGDIVFTREAPAGEAGIVEFDDCVFLGQRTMQFRPDTKLAVSSYLLYEMMGSGIKKQMGKMSSGSTVKHLSVPECKKFKVRRPPIHLQDKFDEIRSKTLRCISGMGKSRKESMFESLSQKAFNGKI